MGSDIGPTASWSETLDKLARKHREESSFDTSNYLEKISQAAYSMEDLDDLISAFQLLRDDLDETSIHKDLKIQILLDVLEVIFKMYEGKSVKQLLPRLLSIFNPMDYARQIFYTIEEKLDQYQKEEKKQTTDHQP